MTIGISEDGSDTTQSNRLDGADKKHQKVIIKLNMVINAIDHFDIRERTGYNIQVDRDYVENLRNDVKKNKRSLSGIEVMALNEIWKTYKGASSTGQINKSINAVEKTKKKKFFGDSIINSALDPLASLKGLMGGILGGEKNLLSDAISDAKDVRRRAIEQAKMALEEPFAPTKGLDGRIHRLPPPPPPPRPQNNIKKSKLQEIIREEIREMMKEEQNKKPKPKPRKTWV